MEEKLKIYVPESIHQILLEDMARLEFFKKDGSLNKNAFLNQLIINYDSTYYDLMKHHYAHIEKLFSYYDVSCFEEDEIIQKLAESFITPLQWEESSPKKQVLSLKPTKQSQSLIEFIQHTRLTYCSLSSYFRDLFTSYARLPQDKREQIICKDAYDAILEGIERSRKVYLTLQTSQQVFLVDPYAVAKGKEELFTYFLGVHDDVPHSFRLSRIKKAIVTSDPSYISEEHEEKLNRSLHYGPQFAINTNTKMEVRLTEAGQKKFTRLYVHRPAPYAIQGDRYYFDCSEAQVLQYFFRFGKDAQIISPPHLKESMITQLKEALEAYEKSDR